MKRKSSRKKKSLNLPKYKTLRELHSKLSKFGIKNLKTMRNKLHPMDPKRESVFDPIIAEKFRKKYS